MLRLSTWLAPLAPGAVAAACALALVQCRGGAGARQAQPAPFRIAADPQVALAGQTVALAVEGDTAGIDAGSAEWSAGAGTVKGEGLAASWDAPERVGTFTVAVQASSPGGGRVVTASLPVKVVRFGPPPQKECAVPCDRIYRGYARRDEIEALTAPRFVPAAWATGLRDDDPVIGVDVDGVARAYPERVLAYHEVINDTLGGRRITVAYSPLAGYAAAFFDERGGFGSEGALYEGFSLVYDHATGSAWLPVRGECVQGAARGARLVPARHVRASFKAWKELRPAATVSWPVVREKDRERYRYDLDPFAWYERDDAHLVGPLGYFDLRMPKKRRVLGVSYGGMARTWPLPAAGERLAESGVLNGEPYVAVADGGAAVADAFLGRLDGRTLAFELLSPGSVARHMKDRETGTTWNVLGEGVEGPQAGARLATLDPYVGYFFAWAAFRPESDIVQRKGTQQ